MSSDKYLYAITYKYWDFEIDGEVGELLAVCEDYDTAIAERARMREASTLPGRLVIDPVRYVTKF